ncbi:YaaC family protein [Streptomyces sp. NPDC101234]|uniref:YaaC family protein n=1 Tax=Streptomyces sp. NPDC101234 TaxID=3366138 RepID=UPI00380D70DE
MTAAHTAGQFTFDKHGLKIVDMKCGIPDIAVRPAGVGASQAVSDATESEPTADTVSLGAVWSSLPELAGLPLHGTKYTPAAEFMASNYPSVKDTEDWQTATTATEFLQATVWVNEDMPSLPDRRAWARDFLTRYPVLEGGDLWGDEDDVFVEIRPGRFSAELCWPAPKDGMRSSEIAAHFDTSAPVYRFNEHRHLRPAFEPGRTPPTPLMPWWLLLYSFSMLARYQPPQVDRGPRHRQVPRRSRLGILPGRRP